MIPSVHYPGGKGKCYQQIINLLPPHGTYIETHLGGGAVLRHKRPAETSIGIDRDPSVVELWRARFPELASYVEADAVDFLASRAFDGDEVIYCDPPYLPATRRRARVYRCDYTESDHVKLLEVLRLLPCRVVISGYGSGLYDEALHGWHARTFQAKTHQGVSLEKIWYNFNVSDELHDVRFIGSNFRHRQSVTRRLQRLQSRISQMHPHERQRLIEWLRERCLV
jgi:DNA adenine methylase